MRRILVTIFAALFVGVLGDQLVKNEEIEPYIFEDMINSTIESLRPDIPDPLKIDQLQLNFTTEGLLTGTAGISNLEVTGLQSFQLPYLNLAVIGMQLNFTFVLPSLNINTDYDADVLVAELVPLYGNGKANIHITNLQIDGTAQADLSNGIHVKNLVIGIGIGTATFDIHGILDDEDFSLIVSSILNDVVAKFINEHPDLISVVLSPIVEGVINAILSGGGGNDTTSTVEAPDAFNFIKIV